MNRQTRILVDADVTVRHRETSEEEALTLKNIECVWHWDDLSREAAEYWAVMDYLVDTFGNNIDWFSIKGWSGSPMKEKG